MLSATDIAQLANTSFKLTSSRLEKGWTVQECIDGSRKKKKLMFEFRCKCCGMEITTRSNTQRFCDVLCRDTFKKYPHEYGQWWQE